MSDVNTDFNMQVLRAFVALYRVHPRVIELSSEQTHFPPPTRNDADYADKLASSGGTITWLYRNGRPLGQAAVEAVGKQDEREISVLADLLMDKLA